MYKDDVLVCDQDMCTGCGLCINICPVNAIKIEDLPYSQNAMIDTEKCIHRALTLNPDLKIFPVSAKTGDGMDSLEAWLKEQLFTNTRL